MVKILQSRTHYILSDSNVKMMFSLIVLLSLCSCGQPKPKISIENQVLEATNTYKDNRFIKDAFVPQFNVYQLDEVKTAQEVYSLCQRLITSDSKIESSFRALIFDELLLTPFSNKESLMNSTFKSTRLVTYADYITGSVMYFLEPTNATLEVAREEIQKFRNSADYQHTKTFFKYLQTIHSGKSVSEKFDKKYSPEKAEAVFKCMALDIHLGIVGADTYTKRLSVSLSEILSKRTRRRVLQKYGG